MLRLGSGQKKSEREYSGLAENTLPAAPSGTDPSSSEDTSLPSLEAGKYIHDNIYVGVEQGMEKDTAAVRVEVDLGHGLTLEGKSSSAAGEAGVGWKMEY
jgi:translocation and assembly module TamB